MKSTENTIFYRFGLIDQQTHHWIISLFMISLLILPFGFMTFKSLFGVLSGICLLLSLLALFIKPELVNHFFKEKNSYLIILCLISTPICIFFTQLVRGDVSPQPYDGPMRLAAALIILLAIYKHRIDFSRILSASIPLALLTILIYATLVSNPYGDRLTNNYLDPIIWGNFCVILGFMSLASIQSNDHFYLKTYKIFGFILGTSMSILSQSRSGWMAGIIMTLVLLILKREHLTFKKIFTYIFVLVIVLLSLYLFMDTFKLRIDNAVSEVFAWSQKSHKNSSAGIRLNMVTISSHIFFLSPWVGFGEFSKLPLENNLNVLLIGDPGATFTLKCCGPHNDFLAHALKFGVFGVFSFLSKLFIPIYIFLNSKHHQSAHMGMMLSLGIIICGFFSEMQSLKVSYTFYAVFITGLIATTLWKKSNLYE